MAMTLRLTDEQDEMLTQLAQEQGLSKHEAATRAITQAAISRSHVLAVEAASERARAKYRDLLKRLGE